MAEPLISVLLEQLASATVGEVKQHVGLVTGVKKEVEKLNKNLKAIEAVLLDAEKQQVRDASVMLWLDSLKDVSYEMDYVLDEWNTAILKSKIEAQENQGETSSNTVVVPKKVCFFIPSTWCCIFRTPHVAIGLRHDIACKIKYLNEMLNDIAIEKERYNFSTSKAIEYERPWTSSLVNVSEVFGREFEKHTLISKLLSESSQDSGAFTIVPIVGLGGIGKTTLAQLVYNDDQVRARFDHRIWVCVSDPFDEFKIAKAILESLPGNNASNLGELEALLQGIHTSIGGKRFLLVLDDVWTKDDRKWEQIKKSLESGAVGSRILVTTRKKEVAIMMRAEAQMIRVELLSEDVCWLIFSQLALSGRDDIEQLEDIGEQIARKCKGLPLVAKTLGSLMRFKTSRKQWEDVLQSELWELEDVHIKVFVPFLLSYYDLAPIEKRCFSICSIFPKDSVIKVQTLIYFWMSQGYFGQSQNVENKGQDCFENLAMRSFFQDFEKDHIGNIVTCKMHDIVHDFAQYLTKKECFISEGHHEERVDQENEKIRHMSLVLESDVAQIPRSIYYKKNLCTLFVMKSRFVSTSLRLDLLLSLTRLRSLSLSHCRLEEIPAGIDKLVHLRYLDISENHSLRALPDTLCNLCNLQTLKMDGCRLVENLPREMGRLISLRHLHIMNLRLSRGLPKSIGRLTSLQTLDLFSVPNPEKNTEELMKFEDLNNFKHLQGSIMIEGCGYLDVAEAEKVAFKNRENLIDLELWFGDSLGNRRNNDENILEALQPHPNLKSLQICNYDGSTMHPNWLNSLSNLKYLCLSSREYCESLPPLGILPSLETLNIVRMKGVEKVGLEFLGIKRDNVASEFVSFPKLKQLQFFNLDNWKEWESISPSLTKEESEEYKHLTIMPCLTTLYFFECAGVQGLPDFLQNRPNLKISRD